MSVLQTSLSEIDVAQKFNHPYSIYIKNNGVGVQHAQPRSTQLF